MAINSNFKVSQQAYQTQLSKEVSGPVSDNKAQNLVKNANTGVTKQANKKSEAKEMSHLSEAAQKAMETEALQQAEQEGMAQQAEGQGGLQNQKGLRKKDEENFDGKDLGPGEHQEVKPGYVLVEGESPEDDYQIKEADANKLTRLDAKSNWKEKVLGDMPENVRNIAGPMVAAKTETVKDREKFSELKEGKPEFNETIEGMKLKMLGTDRESLSVPSPSLTPAKQQPMMVPDEQSEAIVKDAAQQQLAANGAPDEAFVA